MYKAGSNNPWRDKNELPYQIKRMRNLKIRAAALIIVVLALKIILIIGMIACNKNIIKSQH